MKNQNWKLSSSWLENNRKVQSGDGSIRERHTDNFWGRPSPDGRVISGDGRYLGKVSRTGGIQRP